MFWLLGFFGLLITVAVLVFYVSWRRRTYCPDGTKHDWEYQDHRWWYWDGNDSFMCISAVQHTVVRYHYTCKKCGRCWTRELAYFGRGPYQPTQQDWEL